MCDTTTLTQYIHSNTKLKSRNTTPYLVTIRKHQVLDYVTSGEIRKVLLYLKNNGIIVHYGRLERHGKYSQLHFHGLVRLPASVRYKDLTRYNGFRVHYQYVKSKGYFAYNYIDKHYSPYNNTELDTILSNYFAYHYAF